MAGCNKPLEIAADGWIPGEDFFNCPRKFIMKNTYELLDELEAYKTGISNPPAYGKQSAKFLQGVKLFENYYSEFAAMQKGK
jgi:hypothetical protein